MGWNKRCITEGKYYQEQYRNSEEQLSLELSKTCDDVKNNIQGLFTFIWRKKNQKEIGSLIGAEGEGEG